MRVLDQSIALYWVTRCYGWIDDGALSCPDPEAASGVRIYSLIKPCWMSSMSYSRYFQRAQHEWSRVPYSHGRSDILLLQDLRGRTGLVSNA